jgi:hypothetical protein
VGNNYCSAFYKLITSNYHAGEEFWFRYYSFHHPDQVAYLSTYCQTDEVYSGNARPAE